MTAAHVAGIPLKEQTIVIVGFGSAGIGIANLLVAAMKEDGLSEDKPTSAFSP